MTAHSPYTHPAERETPAGEAMREAVAYLTPHALTNGPILLQAPQVRNALNVIAAELARLTSGREEAQADWVAQRDHNLETAASLRDAEAAIADLLCDVRDRDAALTALRADHAAEAARLKAKTPFVVTNGERGEDERFRMWSGRAWVWVNSIAYAALFVRKRDANQILPDGDPYDYPDRIRALTLKEAGHE